MCSAGFPAGVLHLILINSIKKNQKRGYSEANREGPVYIYVVNLDRWNKLLMVSREFGIER